MLGNQCSSGDLWHVRPPGRAPLPVVSRVVEGKRKSRRPSATVLIADDNEVARTLYKRVLEQAGYTVLLALDGLEAVEAAVRDKPSVVLMDVAMPGIDGLEAMRRIKSAMPSMPIVIATARAMSSDKESYIAAGADMVLTKPFRLANLLATVAKLTARH